MSKSQEGETAVPREWERRLIDGFDFDLVANFGNRLLEERAKAPAEWEEVVMQALWLAAVVSYSRPFTTRFDQDGQQEPNYFAEVIKKDLTADELDQHKRFITDRHSVHAHSDAGPRNAGISDSGPPFGKLPVMQAVHFPPPNAEVERLIALATKFHDIAVKRRQELGIGPTL